MGESPTFNATYFCHDGLPARELGVSHMVQVDIDEPGRVFVDITCLIARAKDGTLPTSGEYHVDESDDWFEKHGEKDS